ncbi:Putative metabolite transport protein NicT [Burkholderia sp. AD24]|nr:Putative metabolite transport protein NicT [Burkholderia sp. AD24]
MKEIDRATDLQERRLFWRITIRLVPFLFFCYVFAMIDRLNVGFAKLQFMAHLHLTEAVYGTAAGLLYLGYMLFELPSNLMLQRYGVRTTLLRIMVLWGGFTVALAFVSNRYEFYALRFLVGAAEAGFFPGIVLYLSYWFPEHMRGRASSLFVMAVPVSGVIGAPLATWIMTDLDGVFGLRGWQNVFVFEGIPAIVLGVVAYFFLTNRPRDAHWLLQEERRVVELRVSEKSRDSVKIQDAGPSRLRDALKSPVMYCLLICYFAFYCAENAVLVWIPTLLRSVGVSNLKDIGWISGGISVVSTVGLLTICFASDRYAHHRRAHLIVCGVVTSISLLLLPLGAKSIAITVVVLTVCSVFVFGFLALFWTVPSGYFKQQARAGGIALINSAGALGGLLSPIFIGWVKDATGSFYYALGGLGAFFLASLLLLFFAIPRPAVHSTHEIVA